MSDIMRIIESTDPESEEEPECDRQASSQTENDASDPARQVEVVDTGPVVVD